MKYDEIVDVVVVGFGYAGGIAALNSYRSGADTLLIEKSSVPGGISICSYGTAIGAMSPDRAFLYLKKTNADKISDAINKRMASEMSLIDAYIKELASINGASVKTFPAVGNYDFPGRETFYYTEITQVPNFNKHIEYPSVNSKGNGANLFKVIHDNLLKTKVKIRYNTQAHRLIFDRKSREVKGITVLRDGKKINIKTLKGVIIACGGFEFNFKMLSEYCPVTPVLSAASKHNTGDGIKLAQDLGADLYHMWHLHGSYGFRSSDPSYPYGIRVKELPNWFPGLPDQYAVKMPWIILDQNARRYMSEYQPYLQDTSIKDMMYYDPVKQCYPRSPSFLICDNDGRQKFQLGQPTSNDPDIKYQWSRDNHRELNNGILHQANTIEELAKKLGLDPRATKESIARWNTMIKSGEDLDFQRPSSTFMPIVKPPFIGAKIYPIVSNTQGGPRRDEECRIIDVYGSPIGRLYSAGECGSFFGHTYLSCGNISECIITGKIAGRNIARLSSSEA